MKLLVYTCVIGGYDRVFPPLRRSADTDYVIVTDDPTMRVSGWTTCHIDPKKFDSPNLANRYYKMLMHRFQTGYDVSIYIDGNIRLLDDMSDFVMQSHDRANCLTLFRHDRRTSIIEEIQTCEAMGKFQNSKAARVQLDKYCALGFPDGLGLVEAGILIKDHSHPQTDLAMSKWWEEYSTEPTRDQIILPYILWDTKIPVGYQDFNYRNPNRWFGVYPHRRATGVNPRYSDFFARSYDSNLHWIGLFAWNKFRAVKRQWHGRKT